MTDRSISKWETGNGMPDSSIMLELCEILGINVNELLSGEMIEMNKYDKKAEENLLELKRQQEESNRNLLALECIIGFIASISFIVITLVSAFAISNTILQIILIIVAIIIFLTGVLYALKIEKEAGYYECQKCHYKYIPKYNAVFFAMHIGRSRFMKCPKCNKRSWNKKRLVK